MEQVSQLGASDRWLAAGGVAGAVLASSCCVLPLALATLGIGGAWMSRLTALAPLKPYFLTATAVLLGLGFWHVHRRATQACQPGTVCAAPARRRFTRLALWLGAGLAALSASVELWAPFFW
jgi:mercuric ion transport protein